MVLKRRDVKQASGSEAPGLAEDSFASTYPSLWEMVSSARWPDGSSRVTSTLLFFLDDGLIKACLNDRDQGLTAWASGNGLHACLTALEKGILTDTLDWRRPHGSKGKKK